MNSEWIRWLLKRIRLDCVGEANHNLNRLLDKSACLVVVEKYEKVRFDNLWLLR
jgi:hypothetical protein